MNKLKSRKLKIKFRFKRKVVLKRIRNRFTKIKKQIKIVCLRSELRKRGTKKPNLEKMFQMMHTLIQKICLQKSEISRMILRNLHKKINKSPFLKAGGPKITNQMIKTF